MFLFIDTTEKLTLGLVDRNYNWLSYQRFEIKSISAQIHKLVYELLEKHNASMDSLEALIYCAGPGSYTGMRIAEGLASILNWQNLNVYNFYHHEVPQLVGFSTGRFVSKAFKKELFDYRWNENSAVKELVSEEKIVSVDKESVFSRWNSDLTITSSSTDKLIEDHPQKFFKTVVERGQKMDLFYYRSLENEFSKK